MEQLIYYYQHLPAYLDPTAFSLGPLRIDWYSLMYLAGFGTVFWLLRRRIKKGEFDVQTLPEGRAADIQENKISLLFDLLVYIFFGLLVGGRLGYVLFYNLPFYLENPLAVISPFDPVTHAYTGIYGLSYHGGLLGGIAAAYFFARKKGWNFLSLANFVAPAIPAGYFFGRLGNFFNGELYGRLTEKAWGMYFFAEPAGSLRYPSQLAEALLEGLILFAILWPARRKKYFRDKLLAMYLVGYAVARIIAEFFREPDPQIGYIWGFLTLGQILSAGMLLSGLILIAKKAAK